MIQNRANTPEQKTEVIQRIVKHWQANPELRLLQMITWALHMENRKESAFYIEDYDLLEYLDKTFPGSALNHSSNGTENHSTDS